MNGGSIEISLNKQIHVYSVDTSAFYNESEMKIHKRLNKNYNFRNRIVSIKNKKSTDEVTKEKVGGYITNCSHRIKINKDNLYTEFKKNSDIRKLNDCNLIDKNIVSVFESTLTRVLKLPENTLSEEIVIVQTYFFDVIEDIILNGFTLKGEKYVFYTASAGQIRTKKTVFVKESSWNRVYRTLTCGLTIEDINKKGGVNINKYLAYLALCNSATDEYFGFNINKTIVVEDMETLVEGEVDFIDDKTYTIERKTMKLPIPHMDGCGLMLPLVSKKSFMCRLPWVKGLLVPFPYDRFIKEKNNETGTNCGIIKDIYGVEHDILKEDIEVIFTKSQFKMYKYYESWEKYKENFIKYNCQIGICNVEDNDFASAKLNYQMLQTLNDITEEDLIKLSKKTIEDIKKIGKDKETMLKVLGITKSNINKNYIQQALEVYPELLSDTYSKEVLKQTKKSLVKDGRSGKLNLDRKGVYTFIIPDLYAFCEWLFLKDESPKGLLKDNEVYCKIFKDENKLDCLRSPHLYREHAVRHNVVDREKSKWFTTKGLYTSCHDLISRILQFDVDGDKSLVTCNETLLEVAERNMEGVVPLFYNMRKAEPELINNKSIYGGLKAAYTGGNIGVVSNNITKIWNSENINLDAVKLLCMENNFVIDYAKTLYKPERPKDKSKMITDYTKLKVPHFFTYAKDKEKTQVEPINGSAVNKLNKIIPNPNISFKAANLGRFDYKKLMKNSKTELDEIIIKKYAELDLKKHFMTTKKHDEEINNITYLYQKIKTEMLETNSDEHYVTDVLVKYLYKEKKSSFKTTLWECFGDVIVENLKENITKALDEGYTMCEICGERIEMASPNSKVKYCKECARKINIKKTIENRKKKCV